MRLMSNNIKPPEIDLSKTRAPRYTSYPTAVYFNPEIDADFHASALAALPEGDLISVYLHIPFCERLCWFCACRTQGTKTNSPVAAYLNTLHTEIALVAAQIPCGVRIGRLHWGGGTPTILSAAQITDLADRLRTQIGFADDLDFSVEIDPTVIDRDRVTALAGAGMTRASIGIQDFDERVQNAIGRQQSYPQTKECVALLRDAGISSLNTDIVYGLPHQTSESVLKSLDLVLSLAPDRIALFGYAHVPWMAKRQRLIDTAALPASELRGGLFTALSDRITLQGMVALGIDHFALPGDSLARAGANGKLRRNFQGYTDDRCATLVGLGASAISRFRQGYTQNESATSAYEKNICAGKFATFRGYQMTNEDRLRARTIEMIMCDFSVDAEALRREFGATANTIADECAQVARKFGPYVKFERSTMFIASAGRPAARLIAMEFDRKTEDRSKLSLIS